MIGFLALLTQILTITLRAGTSLIYATIGEIITERAGILNLGVEGMMIMGAVTAFDPELTDHLVVLGLPAGARIVDWVAALYHRDQQVLLADARTGRTRTVMVDRDDAWLDVVDDLGPAGLWWGLTAGLAVVAVLLVWRITRRFRGELLAVDLED